MQVPGEFVEHDICRGCRTGQSQVEQVEAGNRDGLELCRLRLRAHYVLSVARMARKPGDELVVEQMYRATTPTPNVRRVVCERGDLLGRLPGCSATSVETQPHRPRTQLGAEQEQPLEIE